MSLQHRATDPADPPPCIVIAAACAEVLRRISEVGAAQDAGVEPRHCPLSAISVRRASRWLKAFGTPEFFRDADLVAAHRDLVGPILARIRVWPEFGAALSCTTVEIRWQRRELVVATQSIDDPLALPGRVRAVPLSERLTWPGEGPAPHFRLELSLPWWLLADDDQAERGLHGLLASCAIRSNGEPVISRPDIRAYASTLGRYGVGSVREANAVFHAQRHPDHERHLADCGFDPVTGQGTLWPATQLVHQQDFGDLIRRRRRPGGTQQLGTDRTAPLSSGPAEA